MKDHVMTIQHDSKTPSAGKPFPLGWGFAVLLVIAVWMAAFVLRGGGGEKEVIVGWSDGMPAGQQLAQEADKPMVVFFTASWCGYCQVLKKNVLTQAEVQSQLQADFVPVQIDLTDQSASNPNASVASEYGVRFLPTIIAMTPEGQPIAVYGGEDEVSTFTGWLSSVSNRDEPVSLR
jgi:thioredoxin-related protein